MGAPMQGDERLEVVKARQLLGDSLIKAKEHLGETYLCVKREALRDLILMLKNDPDLDYGYFSECLGADYSTWTHERDFSERFEVIYNLMSLKHYSRIFVKVGVDDGQTVPSIKDIFLGAEYPEREVWDLLGIVFEGNEQVQRFIMPDDWIGYPLRKEYPLGGEDVMFDQGTTGPAVGDLMRPHAGEGFDGKTGSKEISGR